MPLRDPRPLARALAVVLALAAITQVARMGLRAVHYRNAVSLEDFFLDPGRDSWAPAGGVELQLAEGLLLILVLWPLQMAAGVLWFLWQRRLRRNAVQLRSGDAAALSRRIAVVASVVVAWLVVEAALHFTSTGKDAPSRGPTGVAVELALDLTGLLLLVMVGITSMRWTRAQDRLVRIEPVTHG